MLFWTLILPSKKNFFATDNDEKFKVWKNNIINDVRNLLRLKIVMDDTVIKDMINLFRLKNENESIKERVISDIGNPFEHEEDYYKSIRVGNFWSNIYTKYGNSNYDFIKVFLNQLKNLLIKLDHTEKISKMKKNLIHRKFN